MAENRAGGGAQPSGTVRARVVPTGYEARRSRLVQYDGTRVTARLGPDGMTVAVHGHFKFGSRTGSRAVDLDPGAPEVRDLEAAMRAVTDAYGETAEDAGMSAGYLAREIAERAGEDFGGGGSDRDE